MDQSVHTAEVDEYTVGRDILDSTLEDLSLLQATDDLLLLGLEFLFDESLVRHNDIAELLVDLHNLELHGLAHELVVVAYGMNVNLASGQECLDTKHVNNHTTLGTTLDEALNHLLCIEGGVHTVPRLAQASLLVRENQLTFFVLCALYINFYYVTDLQVGIVAEF